ncbi:MAG: HAMP domain-containing sensor histidine kinase [Pseudomonadota bacterium]
MQIARSSFQRSLSTKLLLLTILFVFVAEVVVLIPSIAYHRLGWFAERIETAYLVGLALDGSDEEMIREDVAMKLFETAGILGVTVQKDELSVLILAPDINPHGPAKLHRVELGEQTIGEILFNPWAALFSQGDRYIRVMGVPRHATSGKADIIVSQRDLRRDLWRYTRNIFQLSLFISAVTAGLVYWALNRMIVKPVKVLTRNVTAFQADPDQAGRILQPSGRLDEIGIAEKSLAAMERRIHELLNERRRLAALGAGISKISHDLRNILASAQLMSDRLAKSDDPRVQKLSPRLVASLDRAVTMSRDTLTFGRMESSVLSMAPVSLRLLIDEVFDATAAIGVTFENGCPDDVKAVVDRTHFYRCVLNLVRNAVDVLTPNELSPPEDGAPEPHFGSVKIAVQQFADRTTIDVIDDGPGVPDHAREALFEPFKGSQKPGGTGLGLAIAHEIAHAHGGRLTLHATGPDGTTFRIELPDGTSKEMTAAA